MMRQSFRRRRPGTGAQKPSEKLHRTEVLHEDHQLLPRDLASLELGHLGLRRHPKRRRDYGPFVPKAHSGRDLPRPSAVEVWRSSHCAAAFRRAMTAKILLLSNLNARSPIRQRSTGHSIQHQTHQWNTSTTGASKDFIKRLVECRWVCCGPTQGQHPQHTHSPARPRAPVTLAIRATGAHCRYANARHKKAREDACALSGDVEKQHAIIALLRRHCRLLVADGGAIVQSSRPRRA